MKIAYVFNQSYFMGGGEYSFFELIRSVNKSSFQPHIVVPAEGEIGQTYRDQHIPVFATPFPSLKTLFIRGPLVALWKYIQWLRRNNIDIIHANGSRACLYSGIAGRILGLPVIWHVRETIRDISWYDRLLGGMVTTIVCASRAIQSVRFEKHGQTITRKIRVVHNAVDTSEFSFVESRRQKVRKERGVSEDTILLGIIGNIIPLKGHDFFLKGLAAAKKKNPALHVQALFAGRTLDPHHENALRRMVEESNLQGHVLFIGFQENVVNVLASLDVFILPSQREGFSRSLLEAMSMGLPVIASKIKAIEEAVAHHESALLVEYGDVDAMCEMIQKLSNDQALRRKLGAAARDRAIREFSRERHANSMEKIYESLIPA